MMFASVPKLLCWGHAARQKGYIKWQLWRRVFLRRGTHCGAGAAGDILGQLTQLKSGRARAGDRH